MPNHTIDGGPAPVAAQAEQLRAELDTQSVLVDGLITRLAAAERHERHTQLDLDNLNEALARAVDAGSNFSPAEYARLEQVAGIAREAHLQAAELRRLTFAAADREAALENQALRVGGI